MGPWHSHFEMLIPGRSPAHLADATRAHGGGFTKVGLIVRVRDGRVRARYNELSRQSTAPLLKARLVGEPAGTRVVGEIQWTNVLAAPFAMVALSFVLLALSVRLMSEGDPAFGLLYLLGGVAFGALSVKGFRSENTERAYEERRLREELLASFTGHRRR